MLRNYTLAPLPLSHGALYFLIFRTRTHLWENTCGEAPLWKKLEVSELRSGALRFTLTTDQKKNELSRFEQLEQGGECDTDRQNLKH